MPGQIDRRTTVWLPFNLSLARDEAAAGIFEEAVGSADWQTDTVLQVVFASMYGYIITNWIKLPLLEIQSHPLLGYL